MALKAIAQNTAASSLPAFDPPYRATLQSQAYQKLRKAVMGGVFKPGTVITIRAAADALSVSPMPVRAALQRLQVEGALVARGSKRVLEIPALSEKEYLELRDIRIVNEGLAAERAAERITPAELQEIERNCAAMRRAAQAGDRNEYVHANWAFHLSVYRASRMETLVSLIETLWLRIGPYVQLMMPNRASLIASIPDHHRVVDACRRKNGKAARRAITDDITHSGVNLIKALHSGAHGHG